MKACSNVFSGSCAASHTDSQCSWASKNAPEWKQRKPSDKSPCVQSSDILWRKHESVSASWNLTRASCARHIHTRPPTIGPQLPHRDFWVASEWPVIRSLSYKIAL